MLACFSQSTAHGLMHIGNEEGTYGKLVWLLLTIATSAIFCGHTHSLYMQMFEEQVFISTHPDAMPFIQPDIVFCSERIFARDYINNPPKDEYAYMLNVSNSIQKFDKIYQKWAYKSSRLIWDSLNFHQLYKAFYHRKEELFLNLTCNLDRIDLSNLKVELNLAHFACYRLSSKHCKLDSPFNSLIVKFYIHIYGTNINYTNINVNINNKTLDSYLFIQREHTDEMGDGVYIYFVQPNEAVNERSLRVLASANTQTDIRIKSTRYVRQTNKKVKCQEKVKFNQFFNLLEEDITQNFLNVTEHSLCIYKQLQYILYRAFKCVSKLFPIPIGIGSNLSFCGDLLKQKSFISLIYSRMTAQKMYETKNIIQKCVGTIPCTSVKHKASVNYNAWPWKPTLKTLLGVEIPEKLKRETKNNTYPGLMEAVEDFKKNPQNILSWKKNFIKVSISSDEFMSTEVEESASYSLKNFFSDVGGIMGFYMGASLLTVCELFRVLYVTLYSMLRSKKEETDMEKKSLNESTA